MNAWPAARRRFEQLFDCEHKEWIEERGRYSDTNVQDRWAIFWTGFREALEYMDELEFPTP